MPKLTTAQQTIIHLALSVLASALVTLIIGIIQYVSTNGVDLPSLAKYAGVGFVTAVSMMLATVRTNPNLAQAEADTLKQVPDMVQALHDKVDQLLVMQQQQQASPAVVLRSPAPVAQPQPQLVPPVEPSAPPAQFVNPAAIPYSSSGTYPYLPAVQPGQEQPQ